MKIIKVQYGADIPNGFTGIVEYEDGDRKEWYKEGNLHREDGPAREYSDGSKTWYKEGKHHRMDGPAIDFANGYKEWWIDNCGYHKETLEDLIELCIFIGKEKGKYDLEWLKFLYEDEIKEFPIIPGMGIDERFASLFKRIFEASK
jgi:hypothetical protein